jgi:hypothetical protein
VTLNKHTDMYFVHQGWTYIAFSHCVPRQMIEFPSPWAEGFYILLEGAAGPLVRVYIRDVQIGTVYKKMAILRRMKS